MQAELDTEGTPGGAIAVVVDGKLQHSAGVGVREVGTSDPVTPDMLFPVASMTKMVTAAAVMSVVEEQKLDLEESVPMHVPALDLAGADPMDVNTHHLLTHTSGFIDFNNVTFEKTTHCGRDPQEIGAYWDTEKEFPVMFPPGDGSVYSNANFYLAGLVAERASGIGYYDLAKQRVLDPAGMTTATFDGDAARALPHSMTHSEEGGQLVAHPVDYIPECAANGPAALLMASVLDYAALAETFLAGGGSMLQPSSVETMMSGLEPTRRWDGHASGYGLFRDVYKGVDIVTHGGEMHGVGESRLTMVPEHDFAVIVMVNTTGRADPAEIARFAVDVFLGLEDVPRAEAKTDPAEWTAYAGEYTSSRMGPMTVDVAEDHLVGTIANLGDLTLIITQVRQDYWYADALNNDIYITFWRDPSDADASRVLTRGAAFDRVAP